METIPNTLFWISNGLLVPVVVLLLLFFLRAIILAGGFFGEFYQRMKLQKQFTETLENITPENIDGLLQQLPSAGNSPLLRNLSKLSAHWDDAAYCEHLLANYEMEAEKELGRSRTFIKLGPMIGTDGYPSSRWVPHWWGLAQGDISSMAYNMQVAFATTVVGLVIAAVGVITLQVKQRWYAREMNDLEYLYKVISRQTAEKE